MHRMPKSTAWLAAATIALLAGVMCDSAPNETGDAVRKNDLSTMDTTSVTIKGAKFELWVARTPTERELGLMHTTADEMQPLADGTERGMLFAFDTEQVVSFWMRNTIVPLDIAFIRTDGQIVKTHTMAPLETRFYPSVLPARYAIEVGAGVLHRLGITEGDIAEISESALKPAGH